MSNEIYRGNEKLKASDAIEYVDIETFKHRTNEIIKCSKDITYFAEHYYTIITLDYGRRIIQLYTKQRELLRFIQDNNRAVVLSSRQAGKTTSYAIFVLWTILFNRDKTILIVANRLETATEILGRIKLAYEELPNWVKPGIITYNEKSVEFSNGCLIQADATSSNSARSKSGGILILDEAAFIDPGVMDKFWSSVYPIVSSSRNSKVIMVSTPNGIGNLFYDSYSTALMNTGNKLGWKSFRIDWWDVPGRDEAWKEEQIASFNGDMVKFNQEYGNCFHGSSYTLLPADTISIYTKFVLSKDWLEPIQVDIMNTKFKYSKWIDPLENRAYILGADVADGVGGDTSTILVFDISNGKKIKQVAEFSSNQVSTIEFSYILVKMARLYNNAYIAVEANGIGTAVLDMLESVYQYEYIVDYGRPKRERGIYSHVQLKAKACMWLKDLCVSTDIIIYSKNLILEMEFFEKKSGKFNIYQAVSGKHDDFIMSFIWAMFCLKEDIIENVYIVEKFFETRVGVKLPEIIRSLSDNYYRDEDSNHSDLDEDSIFRKMLNGESNATPSSSDYSNEPNYNFDDDGDEGDNVKNWTF